MQRIDHAGGGNDRGAVLIVMKDGDVHQFAQALFDDETVGRLDVLEVDAAEARTEIAHTVDEGVDVVRIDFEIDRVDVGEALEEDGLAFHHRLGGERAEIAETQDRRAVRDHRDEVAARRVIEHGIRPLRDFAHRNGHAGRIGEAQIPLRRHRLGRPDLDFSGLAARMKGEHFFFCE